MRAGLPVTVVGFLTSTPELRTTPGGASVTNFTIAYTPRKWDKASGEWRDGTTMWVRCTAWRDLAENLCASMTKGCPAFATGPMTSREYEDAQGNTRVSWEMSCEAAGVNLEHATVTVTRTRGDQQGEQQQGYDPTTQGFPGTTPQSTPQSTAQNPGQSPAQSSGQSPGQQRGAGQGHPYADQQESPGGYWGPSQGGGQQGSPY